MPPHPVGCSGDLPPTTVRPAGSMSGGLEGIARHAREEIERLASKFAAARATDPMLPATLGEVSTTRTSLIAEAAYKPHFDAQLVANRSVVSEVHVVISVTVSNVKCRADLECW